MNRGLEMRYFVLKPSGTDAYAAAARAAMRKYASLIEPENSDLARELRNWADDEQIKTLSEDRSSDE